jgi:hypothetical protein
MAMYQRATAGRHDQAAIAEREKAVTARSTSLPR